MLLLMSLNIRGYLPAQFRDNNGWKAFIATRYFMSFLSKDRENYIPRMLYYTWFALNQQNFITTNICCSTVISSVPQLTNQKSNSCHVTGLGEVIMQGKYRGYANCDDNVTLLIYHTEQTSVARAICMQAMADCCVERSVCGLENVNALFYLDINHY